jgi:putative transposase
MTSTATKNARQRYPSDLSEERWQVVSPLIPPRKALGRPRSQSVREIVDAINYHWETGCAWRMLPHDFPPWGTVYSYFRKWQRTGVLRQLQDQLLRPTRTRKTTSRQPTFASRDFQNPDVASTTMERNPG